MNIYGITYSVNRGICAQLFCKIVLDADSDIDYNSISYVYMVYI